jgi:tetratricopeptide (TPR) repeat protein
MFASYPKLDRVLFLYGYLLSSAKYMKESRIVFDKLLKSFPASSFVPDAFLVMADYFFEQSQLADAEAFYTRVLKFPKSSAYGYALYKLGFVQLAAQKPDLAAVTFEQAAKAAAPPELTRAARDASCQLQAKVAVDYAAVDRPDLEGAARGKAARIVPLTACEEAELVSQGAAAEALPEDASVDARIRIASRYRVAGRYESALPLLIAVVEKYPMNGGAELAANLLLDTLVRAKQYDRVLEWVDRFANDRQFLDSRTELQRSIKLLRSRSLRTR